MLLTPSKMGMKPRKLRQTIRDALDWNPFDEFGRIAKKLNGHVKRMRAKVCGQPAAA